MSANPAVVPERALASFYGQFGHPHGVAGRVAGAIMARENRRTNLLIVNLFALTGEDRVLELGCGPGIAAKAAAELAAHVVAVDPSPEMATQARRRLARHIRAERADVVCAPAESLPLPDASVSCAFAVNSIQHWNCHRGSVGMLSPSWRRFDPRRGRRDLCAVTNP